MSQDNPFATVTQTSIVSEQLQKVKEVGLSADAIESAFAPMVNTLRILEAAFITITSQKNINEETIKAAKDLRLRMVKLRTGTDKVHKEQKEEFLVKGRAVDAIKNVLTAAVYDKEKKLSEIENHFINIEKEAKLKLFNERKALLEPLIGTLASTFPLGELDQDSFENMLNAYRVSAEEKAKREQQAELERKEAEEKKVIEEKRIREENEALKKQNELIAERFGLLMSTGAFHIKNENGIKGFELIRIRDSEKIFTPEESVRSCDTEFFKNNIMSVYNAFLEDNRNTQHLAWQEEQKKIKSTEEKLKKEREERKRLEDEAAEKAAKEEADRKATLAAKRKAERAPDKEKLMNVVSQIISIGFPSCKDEEAIKILENAQGLLAKVVDYITDNANKL